MTSPTAPADHSEREDFESFCESLDLFVHATKRTRARLPEEALDLSMSQFHLLGALDAAEGPLAVSELAHAAELSVPTVTRMLDGLVRKQIVSRDRDSSDRRVVRVALTDRGRELVATKRAVVRERRTALFDSLSPGERREAARLLRRLASALDEV